MLIAISAFENNLDAPVNERFGRAKGFVIYDDEVKSSEFIENKQNLQAAQGAGIQSAQKVYEAGAKVLISGHCGPKAFKLLQAANVKIFLSEGGSIRDNIKKFNDAQLEEIENADVEGHW